MTKSGSAGGNGVLSKRRTRFNRWRRTRPFAGGALLILASFIIAWVPIHIAGDTILLGRALAPIGLLFAALVFLCGIFALTRPALADIFGIFGVVFTIFSLYGALAGLFIGLIPGIFGGVLCYAWQPEDESEEETGGSGGSDESEPTDEESGFDFGASTEDEGDSDELFGSRSVRSVSGPRAESKATGAGGRLPSVVLLAVTVVVLGAFAQPFLAAAAQPFPAQGGIGGFVVVAQQFSGTGFSHKKVITDSSSEQRVPAAQLTFTSASMQGVTIYKSFHTDTTLQSPFYIKITGSSASAPKGIVLTVSEFYASEMSLGGVIPLARQKWTTCPGKDFLLSVGDLGPLPAPPIQAEGVTTLTHKMYTPTITIENLTLTVQKGTLNTQVTGTPECTTGPVKPILGVLKAIGLEIFGAEAPLPKTVSSSEMQKLLHNDTVQKIFSGEKARQEVLSNGAVSSLSAPKNVSQGETFTVSARITNTGYVNDTMSVEYRFGGTVEQVKNVTLKRNESTTVTFTDTASNVSEGTYKFGVYLTNGSATGNITVVNETKNAIVNALSVNATETGSNDTAQTDTTTNETVSNQSSARQNTTNKPRLMAATAPTTNDTATVENGTTTTSDGSTNTTATETTTKEIPTSNDTTTPTTQTPTSSEPTATPTSTPKPTPTPTATQTPAEGITNETTPTPTPSPPTTQTPIATTNTTTSSVDQPLIRQ